MGNSQATLEGLALPAAPKPQNERSRLDTLLSYNILDTAPEAAFDDLAQLVSQICGTPIALVSLVDADRQWFKASHGLPVREPIEI
jgi:GAF domain-containing protein